MKFEMKYKFFDTSETFSQENAPDRLTSAKTIKGSTMDCRWFWEDHVLVLDIGKSVETDFQVITRVA